MTDGFPQFLSPAVRWAFDGGLGVRFFFVISGFLITHLLLREHSQTGRINLSGFYARRALRILPVYWMFLLVVLALQMLTPWRQLPITWIANLTFTSNFLPGNWVTGHLWSLAVEEQFYLLWPLTLSLILKTRGLIGVRRVLMIPIILCPVFRVVGYTKVAPAVFGPIFGLFSFFLQCDSLAVGCALATAFDHGHARTELTLKRHRMISLLSALALVVIPYVLTKLLICGLFTVPFGYTAQAVGMAILLWQSMTFPALFPFLNWKLIRWLGVLSYSVYIWQQLFCSQPAWFGGSHLSFMSFPWYIPAALATAIASYYCLEKPLLGLRSKLRTAPFERGASLPTDSEPCERVSLLTE